MRFTTHCEGKEQGRTNAGQQVEIGGEMRRETAKNEGELGEDQTYPFDLVLVLECLFTFLCLTELKNTHTNLKPPKTICAVQTLQ